MFFTDEGYFYTLKDEGDRIWHKTRNQHYIFNALNQDLRDEEDLHWEIPVKKAVYTPYVEENPMDDDIHFNTFFPGITRKICFDEHYEDLDPANEELLKNVFGEGQEREWGEAWMNAALHLKRTDTALFCYGPQGIGKTLLAEFMIKAIGDGTTMKTPEERFNGDLRKPFIFFEEVNRRIEKPEDQGDIGHFERDHNSKGKEAGRKIQRGCFHPDLYSCLAEREPCAGWEDADLH